MEGVIYLGPAETDEEGVEALYEHTDTVFVDTETVSLKSRLGIGVGIAYGDHRLYVQVLPDLAEGPALSYIMQKLSHPHRLKVYHNAMFDLRVLREIAEDYGFDYPDEHAIADTSIMRQVSGYGGSLDAASLDLMGWTNPLSIKGLLERGGRGSNMLLVPFQDVGMKCLGDVYATKGIYERMDLTLRQRDCYDVDIDLIPILLGMERKGLALDQPLLEYHQERLKREKLEYEEYCETLGLQPGSGAQVGYVLASRGNILPFTKSKKQLRTDEEVLEEIDDPLAQMILRYRGVTKLLSTYVTPWVGAKRAYTHFRIDLATGRLASYERNFQNIPDGKDGEANMREVFLPDNGCFSWMDYSQIELRVLAHISEDVTMLDEYTKPNPDLHTMTAEAAGISRTAAKTFNFARAYGAGDRQLSKKTGVPLDQLPALRATWAALYPQADRWFTRQRFQHNGEWVESAFGRRMVLPQATEDMNVNPKAFESHVGKCAMNYPIQGTAADIIKRATVELMTGPNPPDLRVQVHDELIVDGEYEFSDDLVEILPGLKTPFEQTQAPRWR